MVMNRSLDQVSMPPLMHARNKLVAILEKRAASAEASNIAPSARSNCRLDPDRFPLGRQVQIASDMARRGAARMAGLVAPSMADKEATFPDLIVRLQQTIVYLETLPSEQIDGSESRSISLPMGEETMVL